MPAFQGRTDYFSSFTRAVTGVGFFDFQGFYDEASKDEVTNRLRRYRRAWRFYRGDHYDQPKTDSGRKKAHINFCKKFVDKAVVWLTGRSFSIDGPSGHEEVTEYVNNVWKNSHKDLVAMHLAMYGAICGDVCAMLQLSSKSRYGFGLSGRKRSGIRIHAVNPMFAFPRISATSPMMLDAMTLQYPMPIKQGNTTKLALVTKQWTDETVEEWQHLPGERKGDAPNLSFNQKRENPWGFVPFVWFQNLPVPTSFTGVPDINEDVIGLNEIYNAGVEDEREIVEYHSAPVTVIYGGSSRSLEKGPNKVWSGLSKDARVENLRLEGDLSITENFLNRIEQSMLRLADTPGVLLGDEIAISNTSRAALEITFLPMFEKTRTKHVTYGTGFSMLNALIARGAEVVLKEKFDVENEDEKYDTWITWPFPLPIDEATELDADTKKLDLRITSRRELLRKYSKPGQDVQQTAVEISADAFQEMVEEVERSRLSTDPDRPIVPQVATGDSIAFEVPDFIASQDILSPESTET